MSDAEDMGERHDWTDRDGEGVPAALYSARRLWDRPRTGWTEPTELHDPSEGEGEGHSQCAVCLADRLEEVLRVR